jgi:hypothetical protein
MKPKFILFSLALLCLQPLAAQEDYGQNVVNALYMGQYADALDYYDRHKDSIAGWHLLVYKAITSVILNRPDSAIAYLNTLLNEYTYADSGNSSLTEEWYYKWLIYTYYHNGDYEDALRYVDSLSVEARHQSENFEELKNFVQSSKRYPSMEILNTGGTEEIRIKTDIQTKIICNALYNSYPTGISTLFDTGYDGYFSMSKEIADSIGVRILEEPFWFELNRAKVLTARGVIDSVRIGNLLIKNAMVAVSYSDTILDAMAPPLGYKPSNITLGLPLIKRLNHIQIDIANNEMVISLTKKELCTKKANLFSLFGLLPNETLYAMCKLNGVSFTVYFDIGADYKDIDILICNNFYQKYNSMFSDLMGNNRLDGNITVTAPSYQQSFKFLAVPELLLQLRDLPANIQSNAFIILDDDTPFMGAGDGVIGVNFLRKFRKVTLDFYNMRLELD